jgi:hypothetical protein
MHSPLTEHARARMQQRGIPPTALDLLLDYGREAHDHRGCRIVRFDKRSRRRVLGELGRERFLQVERLLDAYAVVAADDAVVTVGHRLRSSPPARHRAQRSGVQP